MAKKINSGQKLYSKAKKLIPGGTMLFSKKPELYLPDRWPSYYSKAKGSYVWDLDNNGFRVFNWKTIVGEAVTNNVNLDV